jgi:osmotically inducible lipoprotein OsmB
LCRNNVSLFVNQFCEREIEMKTNHRLATTLTTAAVILSLSACSGMSTRDKNTAIGAGVGAAAGAVLTNGSALGTVGGAAVGGIIGNQIGK